MKRYEELTDVQKESAREFCPANYAEYVYKMAGVNVEFAVKEKTKDLKIGDTVYQCAGFRIYSSTIQNIYFHQGRTIYDTDGIAFDKRAIGESIFTSKEEAEKLLIV